MYDFDTVIDRRGTASVKWDVTGPDELPMWVADMDFQAAPEIREALAARVAHGVFGYSMLTDAWYDAYTGWWRDRHGFTMDRSWLLFCNGVVPAISSAIRCLTGPGDHILLQTPVYNCFHRIIRDNGRVIRESRLTYSNSVYGIDWENLEAALAEPETKLMLLCNPHNPIGKQWDRETLARIGKLCKTYHVLVLSDEIHCDIAAPGHGYVPFASVNEDCLMNSVTFVAPTKCFNLAGIHSSAVIVPDAALREKLDTAMRNDELCNLNAFAVDATVAAFTKGGAWLDALCEYLWHNRAVAEAYMRERIPGIVPVPGDATYLMWLDCGALTDDSVAFADFIRKDSGLFVSNGTMYGEAGRCFLRFNIACPRVTLMDGLDRLARSAANWRKAKEGA